jgi:hypothetical protein
MVTAVVTLFAEKQGDGRPRAGNSKMEAVMGKIKDIETFGRDAKGKKDLIRYLNGERLTPKQAILAKCYDCLGGYCDGKDDCKVPDCSLYGFMPYRENQGTRPKRVRTEKQIANDQRLTFIRPEAHRKAGL